MNRLRKKILSKKLRGIQAFYQVRWIDKMYWKMYASLRFVVDVYQP